MLSLDQIEDLGFEALISTARKQSVAALTIRNSYNGDVPHSSICR